MKWQQRCQPHGPHLCLYSTLQSIDCPGHLRTLPSDTLRYTRCCTMPTQASGCNVPGATKYDVHSSADVQKIMAIGSANRHTSETKMNDRSSRSHQILTVLVEGQHLVTGGRSHGCLHLIDLAGSERVGKSEASGG